VSFGFLNSTTERRAHTFLSVAFLNKHTLLLGRGVKDKSLKSRSLYRASKSNFQQPQVLSNHVEGTMGFKCLESAAVLAAIDTSMFGSGSPHMSVLMRNFEVQNRAGKEESHGPVRSSFW
jgi:hypothetical protein